MLDGALKEHPHAVRWREALEGMTAASAEMKDSPAAACGKASGPAKGKPAPAEEPKDPVDRARDKLKGATDRSEECRQALASAQAALAEAEKREAEAKEEFHAVERQSGSKAFETLYQAVQQFMQSAAPETVGELIAPGQKMLASLGGLFEDYRRQSAEAAPTQDYRSQASEPTQVGQQRAADEEDETAPTARGRSRSPKRSRREEPPDPAEDAAPPSGPAAQAAQPPGEPRTTPQSEDGGDMVQD